MRLLTIAADLNPGVDLTRLIPAPGPRPSRARSSTVNESASGKRSVPPVAGSGFLLAAQELLHGPELFVEGVAALMGAAGLDEAREVRCGPGDPGGQPVFAGCAG